MTFRALQQRASALGEIALGLRVHEGTDNPVGRVVLNPHPTERLDIVEGDEVVVLSTYTMRAQD